MFKYNLIWKDEKKIFFLVLKFSLFCRSTFQRGQGSGSIKIRSRIRINILCHGSTLMVRRVGNPCSIGIDRDLEKAMQESYIESMGWGIPGGACLYTLLSIIYTIL